MLVPGYGFMNKPKHVARFRQ